MEQSPFGVVRTPLIRRLNQKRKISLYSSTTIFTSYISLVVCSKIPSFSDCESNRLFRTSRLMTLPGFSSRVGRSVETRRDVTFRQGIYVDRSPKGVIRDSFDGRTGRNYSVKSQNHLSYFNNDFVDVTSSQCFNLVFTSILRPETLVLLDPNLRLNLWLIDPLEHVQLENFFTLLFFLSGLLQYTCIYVYILYTFTIYI